MDKKYSDWFKVDLHIHTDFSNKTKQNDYDGTFDINILKEKLRENEVKLFSLTDHNIINTGAYEEYYNDYSNGDPVLLVGCEFDISVKQEDDTFLTYHTLLIFNEDSIEKVKELSTIIESHFEKKGIDYKNRSLNADEIFELFHKYNFFYIPHAGGHKNIISAYKDADIKKAQEMVLLMECAHEKVKEHHRIKHHEGFDKLKEEDFRNQEDEAFINFSDNHNCENYPIPKSGEPHEFYCIKGEPTFETLRFAFIDPQSRIKKQTDVDQIKNVKKYIAKLKIEKLEGVEDNILDLSPNLNVIIGGASSGKSLLFNMLGRKIEHKKQDFEKYQKADGGILIKASTSNTFQSNLSFNNEEIIYINQGDVVKYFEKGNLKDLISDSGKEEEYETAKTKFLGQKSNLIDQLENFKNSFERLNNSFQKDFVINEGDYNNMLSDKFYFTEIRSLQNELDFDTKEDLIENLKSQTEELKKDDIFEFDENELAVLTEFENLLDKKTILIKNKRTIQDTKLSFLRNSKEIVDHKNNTLESSSRAKTEAFKRKEIVRKSCSTLFSSAYEFQKNSQKLENYKCEEKEELNINESVTLILELDHNSNLKKKIIGCINNSDAELSIYDNFLFLIADNKRLKDYNEYTEQRLIQKLKRELETILENYDSPNTYLDYGESGNSKNKSPGFNAEMYLKTILQHEDCKLVMIDQPEDNLGNTFKNEDLINLLRKYKFSKQIILVTHNPSIVVYGDAENIILAENDKGLISYKQVVLEKKENQKLIIDNLDGGKAIFNMRSRKYNIKKLLNS